MSILHIRTRVELISKYWCWRLNEIGSSYLLHYWWNLFPLVALYYRDACSIEFDDQVIVTGGYYTKNTVSIYNDDGWVQDLANLTTGRYLHSCSYFTSDDDLVTKHFNMSFKYGCLEPWSKTNRPTKSHTNAFLQKCTSLAKSKNWF